MFKKIIKVTTYHLNSISSVRLNKSNVIISSIYEFVLIFFALIIFRPSILSLLSVNSLIEVSLMVSFIFSVTGCTYYIYVNKINKYSKWTYKEDALNFFYMMSYGIIILLFYAYLVVTFFYSKEFFIKFNIRLVFNLIAYVLFTGAIIYSTFKFLDYVHVFKLQEYQSINTENDEQEFIVLYGKNKDEYIKMAVNEFLYLKSYGHYINVYLKSETSEVEVKTIRNSLNNILSCFNGYENLVQCHRSYLINIDCVDSIEGNSRKAILKLYNMNKEIPVSRVNYRVVRDYFLVANLHRHMI